MSLVIHFSPDLGSWLTENLDGGRQPDALIETMIAEQMEPAVAHAIVDAFLSARRAKRPVPVDSITVDEAAIENSSKRDAPIVKPGSRLQTSDRTVHVLARADRPVLAVLGGVLSADECAELIELARPRLTPSTIVDPYTGQDVVATHRNSFGMFFRPRENAFIARLDRRLSELMNLPVENGEGLQILYYPTGALNAPHFDFLVPSNAANQASIARSGQRVSSLVTYLNDVQDGGETIFPKVGFSVAPQRGNGVYFEYCNRRGDVDHDSLHGSNPVLAGEKWVATKWMRQRPFVSAGAAA